MSQSPTPPPNDPSRSDDRRSRPATGPLRPLEFDEMVALFVAFLSLGGVLFWGLTRGEVALFSDDALTTPPVATVPQEGTLPLGGDLTADADTAVDDEAVDEAAATALEEDVDAAANGGVRPSAVSELSARAAARRERLAARKPIWEDVRDGVA
ncbi:MAG: hypothetical protein AAF528_03990, partial [Cyanobacteria bacterium P01_C01_bin.121]